MFAVPSSKKALPAALIVGFLFALITGCSESKPVVEHNPVAIESDDTCHLCGMIIKNFEGPKGELYVEGSDNVKRFCSTKDLFAWMLQPENKPNVAEMYVHDMTTAPWLTPDDNAFIDARTAWYVAGSSQNGAMGSTLGSFAEKSSAEAFAKEFGGVVLGFDEITLNVLNKYSGSGMKKMNHKSGDESMKAMDMSANQG